MQDSHFYDLFVYVTIKLLLLCHLLVQEVWC